MNRKLIVLSGVILISLSILIIWRVPNLNILDSENVQKLSTVCSFDNKSCFTCYAIPSNATSQNYIQLREYKKGRERIIASYERYDQVLYIQLRGDSAVTLVLADTTAYIKSQDTINVKIR